MMTIGEYLKDLRTQKGLSTLQACTLSEKRISQPYIVQVEKGDKTPSVEKLNVFANIYGVNIHSLIDIMVDKTNIEIPIVLSSKEVTLIKHFRKLPVIKKEAFFTILNISCKT